MILWLAACAWITEDDIDAFADADGDGETSVVFGGTDCDDTDAEINSDATEVCDEVDEGPAAPRPYFEDLDRDGYGRIDAEQFFCEPPPEFAAEPGDCHDGDDEIHPGAEEVCDGVDNDCDDTTDVDASDMSTWHADSDSDGFGDAADSNEACDQLSGHVLDDTDCDDTDPDTDPDTNPDAEETCAEGDQDCDGSVDEGPLSDVTVFYEDADGDGDDWVTQASCEVPSGYTSTGGDCDDDASTNPGADEVCDTTDHDCDGKTGFEHNVPGDYGSIQEAVDAAGSGEWICVSAGVYEESVSVNSDVVLRGMGSDVTTIDGSGFGRVLYSVNHPDTAEIGGFTITGGDLYEGGAMYTYDTDALYEDLVFEGNVALDYVNSCYGVISMEGSGAPVLRNIVLRDNLMDCTIVWGLINAWGPEFTFENLMVVDNAILGVETVTGGFSGYGTVSVSIENGIFAGNEVTTDGSIFGTAIGAINTPLTLTNVAIVDNTATAGASCLTAAVWAESTTVVTNTTVTGNSCNNGTGGWAGPGSFTFSYSNAYGNEPSDFGITDPTGTDGNIGKAPQYTDTSGASAYSWDLTPKTASALIDGGDPSILDVDGSTSDIGAYGGPLGESW
ncbi:MAG: hypothetical protein GY884_17430 [Proteobacteria bacterium]|nr:hypothetical protein [Pseudomonadota bacterium]